MQPKKKSSRARKGWRRSHDSLTAPSVTPCPRCNEPRLPHRACTRCGYVNPRISLPVEEEK
ncbi:MAG: 50S ribosomal protein L32 [Phycisphaerae bacterium]|nr:50S ribosomal protein L32 [Phycisphaerae bacterium]